MLLGGLFIGHMTITETKVKENEPEYQKVMSHLEVITREVHPTGTDEIERVREYLRSEFERLVALQSNKYKKDVNLILEASFDFGAYSRISSSVKISGSGSIIYFKSENVSTDWISFPLLS